MTETETETGTETATGTETEAMNMVCPNCHTFQPRAVACNQCGVIVEKVLNADKDPVRKPVVAADDKPKTNKLWAVLLIACLIFYFSKDNDEEANIVSPNAGEQPKTSGQEQLDTVEAVNSDVATKLRRDKVITKLQTLKSSLYALNMESRMPPSNEEGLQSLVDQGLLTQADITDEWGNTFVYRIEWGEQTGLERQYSIFVHSRGPDGISGNDDDVIMP